MHKKNIHITYISTWPVIKDGIATFCENLATNIPRKYKNYTTNWNVIKINWIKQHKVQHSKKVIGTIKYNKQADYFKAAQFINKSDTDLIVIQFINSIYGDFGNYIFRFLKRNKKKAVIILHSVATSNKQDRFQDKTNTLKKFSRINADFVVMTNVARNYLIKKLNFKSKKVHLIYHGAPQFKNVTNKEKEREREKLGFNKEDKIIYTYGILRKDKSVKEIIQSLPYVLKKNKNVKLLITGSEQGNKKHYTKELEKTIKQNKIKKNVVFLEEFINQEDIGKYLKISDLFITAQSNLGLHSSGTLSYALSAGSVIISTPTIHAIELLKNKGLIIKNNHPKTISRAVSDLFNNKNKYKYLKKESKNFSKQIYWDKIAKKYLKIYINTINNK